MDWKKLVKDNMNKAMKQVEKTTEDTLRYKEQAARYDDATIERKFKNATNMSAKMGYMAELKERREYELSQRSDTEIRNAIRKGTQNELIIAEARRRGII